MAFIYKIRNLKSEKVYVGKTSKSIKTRFREHISESETGSQRFLCRAIRKYGKENFEVHLLEECPEEISFEREKHWIKELACLNPMGYNMTPGGPNGAPYMSPTFKISMKEYHSTRPRREYATYGMQGKSHSNATKEKQSAARQQHWSQLSMVERIERSKLISGSKNGMSGKVPKNAVPILFNDVYYESVSAAAKSTGHSYQFVKKHGVLK